MFDEEIDVLEVVDEVSGDTYFYELDVAEELIEGIDYEIIHYPLELDWNSF
jgi:hypothetical protein